MADPTQLIPQITTETKNWVVRVTVTEDIPSMICYNTSKLKRYVFSDIEGNEVIAAIYGPDVDVLSPRIKLYGVYDISNADVRITEEKYRLTTNPFQWNLRRHTPIRAVPEVNPQLRYFLDSLSPFSLIANADEAGIKTADIMGVLIKVDEIKQPKNGYDNVQHFTIINPEKIPLCISLCNDMITTHSNTLIEAVKTRSVVVARRLTIKSYEGVSLAAKNSSSFAINPPIEAVTDMMSWFNTLSESELDHLKSLKISSFTRQLVTSGRMRTRTINEVATILPNGEYWVKGFLRLIDENQTLYYTACNHCLTKIKYPIGHRYVCFLCNKPAVACLKPLVVMLIADHTNIVPVVAIEQVAEIFLQTTEEDMMRLHTMGQKLELESIKACFEGKLFLMQLRRTSGKNAESPRRLLLLSYQEEPASESSPSTTWNSPTPTDSGGSYIKYKKDVNFPLSPLKRQLSQIEITSDSNAKKLLTWNEESEEQQKANDGNDEEDDGQHV